MNGATLDYAILWLPSSQAFNVYTDLALADLVTDDATFTGEGFALTDVTYRDGIFSAVWTKP
jgi:hypothetical protein